jgi:hypothetical protein
MSMHDFGIHNRFSKKNGREIYTVEFMIFCLKSIAQYTPDIMGVNINDTLSIDPPNDVYSSSRSTQLLPA